MAVSKPTKRGITVHSAVAFCGLMYIEGAKGNSWNFDVALKRGGSGHKCLSVCFAACHRDAASVVLCERSARGKTTLGQSWKWDLLFQVWLKCILWCCLDYLYFFVFWHTHVGFCVNLNELLTKVCTANDLSTLQSQKNFLIVTLSL